MTLRSASSEASRLIERYGSHAGYIAAQNAQDALDRDDLARAAFWMDVVHSIKDDPHSESHH